MKRFEFLIPDKMNSTLNRLVIKGYFKTKSEAIRHAIRETFTEAT